MPNYADSRVYKMLVGDELYVGSTTMALGKRFICHRAAFNKGIMSVNQPKLHNAIDLMLNKFLDVKIEIIEQVSCQTQEELLARERYWIHELKPTLNTVKLLNKTKEDQRQWEHEYRQKTEVKVKKAERDRKYKEKNREVVLQKKREYAKTHERKPLTQEQKNKKNADRREKVICPHCDGEYCKGALTKHIKLVHDNIQPSHEHREKMKEYFKNRYRENKTEILDKQKERYEEKKEAICASRKQKVSCPHCSTQLSQCSLSRHIRAKHPDQASTSQS